MKKHSFVFGALILAVSGVVCKVLGAVYKIPLTNILGSEGMGVYYLIFPIYAFLLSFISSSFVVALSKNVSKLCAVNRSKNAYDLFKSSIILLTILGIIFAFFLMGLSKIIASLQGVEGAYLCYIFIAPSLVAVSISSAFKGYFQGLQNMVPTALSQVVAQLLKLAGGFFLASVFVKKGIIFGALGALLGISISEVVTLLFFIVYFLIFKIKNRAYYQNIKGIDEKANHFSNIKFIIKEAIPLTLSSIILPMSMVIDSFLIINILKSMSFDKSFATSLLGLNSGVVNTLIGLPTTICSGICMTVIPYITHALSNKNYKEVSNKTILAIKLSLFIAVPCVAVFGLFSVEILKVLYAHSFKSLYELNFASTLLVLSAINILYLTFLQLTTAILQAINRSYVPVMSLAIALIFKVICEVALISIPYLNIVGAIVSNVVCYFISSVINIVFIKKQIKLNFSFYRAIICPVLCTIVACVSVFLLKVTLSSFMSSNWAFLVALVLGALIYIVLIFVLKGFSKEEKMSLFKFGKFKSKSKQQISNA